MDQAFIKDLITVCDSVENADRVIGDWVGKSGTQAKIDFVEELFGIEVRSRNDPKGTGPKIVLDNDYYALLGSVINLRG